MNKRNNLFRASNWLTLIATVACSAITLWASPTPNKCKTYCSKVKYQNSVYINLIVTSDQEAVVCPECACVNQGGTVIWQSDPGRPWTLKFPGPSPIEMPGTISDFDDTWTILANAATTEYYYKVTIDDLTIDPHVVVGQYPFANGAVKPRKAKKIPE